MKNIKRLWTVILCGVVLMGVLTEKSVVVYAKNIYEVTFVAIDVNTGEQVGHGVQGYYEGDIITETIYLGGRSGWFVSEQYQIVSTYVSCDTEFPVTVTSDMTITEYYKATYYDVSGVGGEYDSLEELYAAREAAQNPTQPEATAPSPTEEPTQTETATPTLTEEPTQLETPEPTEEPTQPETTVPSPTEKPTQPETATPTLTEEPTQPETPEPTEEPTQPETTVPSPTEKPTQTETATSTLTEKPTQPEMPAPTEEPTQMDTTAPASTEEPAQPDTTAPSLTEKHAQSETTVSVPAETTTPETIETQSSTEQNVSKQEKTTATETEGLPVSAEAASRHGMTVIIVLSSILICAGAASGFIFFKKHKK